MKSKWINLIFLIFTIIFIMYPTLIILFNNILISILVILMISLIFYFNPFKIKEVKHKYMSLIIFILTLVSRLIVVFLLNYEMIQISDFGNAFIKANTLDFSATSYTVFSHWILYPKMMNLIFSIFGYSQLTALIFNALILSFIPVFIYLIGSKLFKNKNIGLIGSIIYMLWPSTIFYVTIFTPDHVVALLLMIALYIYIYMKDNLKIKYAKRILIYILIGVILGISTFFKNFAPVFLLALIIVEIIYIINKFTIKKFLICVVMISVVYGGYFITKQVTFLYLDDLVGNKIGRNIAPCYINVGLHSISKGHYNSQVYSMYFNELEKNNYNFDKTNETIMNNLFIDIKQNYKILPKTLYYKTSTNFSDDGDKLEWVINSMNAKDSNNNSIVIKNIIIPLTDIYYIGIIIFMVIALFKNYKNKDINILFPFVVILGVAFMLLLTEAQGRYRYAIEPYMTLLAGYGVYNYYIYIRSIRRLKNVDLYKVNETKTLY